MKVINLSEQPSLLNQYLKEMRNVKTQIDSMRFRRNIERIGEIMAVEISKQLTYSTEQIQTPLAIAEMNIPQDQVVLGTILRAGLPLHQGFLNMYDHAENAFVSRRRTRERTIRDCIRIFGITLTRQQNTYIGRPHAGNRHVNGNRLQSPLKPWHTSTPTPRLCLRYTSSYQPSTNNHARRSNPMVRRD